jgi:hypothetical protein
VSVGKAETEAISDPDGKPEEAIKLIEDRLEVREEANGLC